MSDYGGDRRQGKCRAAGKRFRDSNRGACLKLSAHIFAVKRGLRADHAIRVVACKRTKKAWNRLGLYMAHFAAEEQSHQVANQ